MYRTLHKLATAHAVRGLDFIGSLTSSGEIKDNEKKNRSDLTAHVSRCTPVNFASIESGQTTLIETVLPSLYPLSISF